MKQPPPVSRIFRRPALRTRLSRHKGLERTSPRALQPRVSEEPAPLRQVRRPCRLTKARTKESLGTLAAPLTRDLRLEVVVVRAVAVAEAAAMEAAAVEVGLPFRLEG